MPSVPYTFANSTGNIPLVHLDVNFSNVKAYANTAGTVTTASQPNITSVGTLSTLTVTGNVTAANFIGNIGGNISNAVYAISAGSAETVTTAAQPNITSVGTLSVLTVTGNIRSTSGVFIGSGAGLTSIPGANISGTVANATYATTSGSATTATSASSATTAGTVTTAAQPNITSVGTLSSLTVTGNVTLGNLTGATLVSATNLTGTVTTAAQPNITSVGNLVSLTVTGNSAANNLLITNKINTTGNIIFGENGTGILYNDTDGFTVLKSTQFSKGAYVFCNDNNTLIGAHPTLGAVLITDYIIGNVSASRGLSWSNGNLTLDTFGVAYGNISNVASITASGTITGAIIKTLPVTANLLPSAGTAGAGSRAFVTDADSVTFGNLLVGGSGNSMPVFSNGTNWYIG